MLPWGLLAASGAGAAGSYEQISTTILTSTTSTVTFSSIAANYKHLELRITARVNANFPNSTQMRIRFNGDTGSNYAYHNLYGNGSSIVSEATITQPEIRVNGFSDANITGNWGAGVITIMDYAESNKNKTLRALTGTANNSNYNRVFMSSGLWMNTAAINSITLNELNGFGWLAGSRFSLYGIKG
jgi:hypothetical protein